MDDRRAAAAPAPAPKDDAGEEDRRKADIDS